MSIVARRPGLALVILLALGSIQSLCASPPAAARVLRLAEMNTDQIRALDRERTVILVPGGIMEEHGPYLPSYSDGYQNEKYTADLAAAIASKEALDEEGFGGHAGLLETSRVMALRPDLVPSTVAQAPSVTARDLPEFSRLATRPEWPGYVGAPRYATPDLGRRITEADTGWNVKTATRLLDGEADERKIARAATLMQNPDVAKILGPSMQRDAAIAKRQQEWIAARDKP
jgi:hypothetical protein